MQGKTDKFFCLNADRELSVFSFTVAEPFLKEKNTLTRIKLFVFGFHLSKVVYVTLKRKGELFVGTI